jgi:hypothetical protein
VRAPFPTDQNAPANLGAAPYLRSTGSICEVKKPVCNGETKKALLVRHSRQTFENLIFERHALIVLLEACLRGVQICKHLEVVDVADLLASVDVNPDGGLARFLICANISFTSVRRRFPA